MMIGPTLSALNFKCGTCEIARFFKQEIELDVILWANFLKSLLLPLFCRHHYLQQCVPPGTPPARLSHTVFLLHNLHPHASKESLTALPSSASSQGYCQDTTGSFLHRKLNTVTKMPQLV